MPESRVKPTQILGDVGEVVEDQQVVAVVFGGSPCRLALLLLNFLQLLAAPRDAVSDKQPRDENCARHSDGGDR